MKKTFRNLLLGGLTAFVLAGCGGTKVYGSNKTVIYRDEIYNITNVQKISQLVEARLPDDSVVDLSGADKGRVEELLDQHDSMFVQMSFMFDDQKMPYRANTVNSWRDYDRMQGSFDDAGRDIARLMKDKKDTQLTLR